MVNRLTSTRFPMVKYIFHGEHYAVRQNGVWHDQGPVVVTFPHAGYRVGLDTPGFGEKWLNTKGISALHIRNSAVDWFQKAEIFDAFAAIRQHLGNDREIVTYGGSMGGYGALLGSGPLRARRVLAIAPQFQIGKTVPPFDTRWEEHAERIGGFIFDLNEMISPDSDIVSLHDPRSIDDRHMRLFAHFPKWRRLLLPYGSHLPMMVLAEARLSSHVTIPVIEGRLDDVPGASELLKARRNSGVYWRTFARQALLKGRISWARTALQRLETMQGNYRPSIVDIQNRLAHAEAYQKKKEAARERAAAREALLAERLKAQHEERRLRLAAVQKRRDELAAAKAARQEALAAARTARQEALAKARETRAGQKKPG